MMHFSFKINESQRSQNHGFNGYRVRSGLKHRYVMPSVANYLRRCVLVWLQLVTMLLSVCHVCQFDRNSSWLPVFLH